MQGGITINNSVIRMKEPATCYNLVTSLIEIQNMIGSILLV